MLATAFSQVAHAPPCVQHGRGVVIHHAPRGLSKARLGRSLAGERLDLGPNRWKVGHRCL